ncbi:MAG: glucans biosynthesis glucosyltransferase MdoH [Rhodobacteraceae bacterium]|nr:glucans biosynthesis glucosyltransferase MdoH [Paracoccaceae bacterium]
MTMVDRRTADMQATAQAPLRLAMPDQDFAQLHHDAAAPGVRTRRRVWALRALLIAFPLVLTSLLVWAYIGWFTVGGAMTLPAMALTALAAFTFFWVAFSVGTAILGAVQPEAAAAGQGQPDPIAGISVAILLPMYGEAAKPTIGTAVQLLQGLQARQTAHRFSLHVLSDSRAMAARAAEAMVIRQMQDSFPHLEITYRWRAENTDYKSGNLREWITRAGAAHEAMLVLDADSVMDRDTVISLADEMAADPAVGLLQTMPRLLPGRSLWQRLQEFSAHVYGVTLGRGLATWAANEANFVGHNALIRVRAFAACAGLPKLPGRRPLGGVILSHDFVEAALLRRAGWGVRLLPDLAGSFEDTPETTVGYIRRDRRWCQGNMQHLRIIGAKGLHPVSRFHLFQGAMAYLSSVTWFLLLVLWVIVGDETTDTGWQYFADGPAPMVLWPDLPWLTHAMIAGVILLTLFLPKFIGAVDFIRRGGVEAGQALAFGVTMIVEVFLSLLIAPMMMVQHMRAVLRTLAGYDTGWAPHDSTRPPLRDLLRFHMLETVAGVTLLSAAALGYLSLWLVPTAFCLAFAAPLSWVLAQDAADWPLFRFDRKLPRAGATRLHPARLS